MCMKFPIHHYCQSLLYGYLETIIQHLDLKIFPLNMDFNFFLLKLSKVPAIYVFDPGFSLFLFKDPLYLTKLRMNCQDELIIAVKIHISSMEKAKNCNYKLARDEIYYTDHYIRWLLHNAGFFEVLGPFTSFPDDYCIRSRLIAEQGHYMLTSNEKIHPCFEGVSIYRATTKTFHNYLERNLLNEI